MLRIIQSPLFATLMLLVVALSNVDGVFLILAVIIYCLILAKFAWDYRIFTNFFLLLGGNKTQLELMKSDKSISATPKMDSALSSELDFSVIDWLNLSVKRLNETWVSRDALNASIFDKLPPSWRCVCDEEKQILVTQLMSSIGEMRDGQYYFCLLIHDMFVTFINDTLMGGFRLVTPTEIKGISSAEVEAIMSKSVAMLIDDARKN